MVEFFALTLLFGDVFLYRDVVGDAAVGLVDGRDDDELDILAAVLSAVVELALPRQPPGKRIPHIGIGFGRGLARLEDARIPSDDFLAAVAARQQEGVVDVFDGGPAVGNDDALRALFHRQGEFAQLIPGGLAFGDVAQDEAHRRAAGAVQLRLKQRAVAALHGHFHRAFAALLLHAQEKLRPARLVLGRDQGSEAALQEVPAFVPQQRGGGEIHLLDHAIGIEGEIADRGEIVEIEIAVARRLQIALHQAQGLVLGLQFDLPHLQFVQQRGDRRCPGRLRHYRLRLHGFVAGSHQIRITFIGGGTHAGGGPRALPPGVPGRRAHHAPIRCKKIPNESNRAAYICGELDLNQARAAGGIRSIRCRKRSHGRPLVSSCPPAQCQRQVARRIPPQRLAVWSGAAPAGFAGRRCAPLLA